MTAAWRGLVEDRNRATVEAGLWRALRPLPGCGPELVLADGTEVVSFASNDYLGLARHPSVVAAATEALARYGAGAGASRLVVGDRPVHHELESALADWKGTEAALVFPTGYMANLGVLTALGGPGTVVVSDELNHASIIDGCRLARAEVVVHRHLDVDHVDSVLAGLGRPAMVVTEAVFSMDGDSADLDALSGVCRHRGALLVVDEAHAVLSPPWAPPDGLATVRVGTLSKALGSVGGYAAGSRPLIDLLVNRARPFVFTTALPPASAAAAVAALGVVRSPEGRALVARLARASERVGPGRGSPIVPVVVGEPAAAVAASDHLLAVHRLVVPAIRPPTVPPGTSRLRVALSAGHTDRQLDRLAKGLADV